MMELKRDFNVSSCGAMIYWRIVNCGDCMLIWICFRYDDGDLNKGPTIVLILQS